MIYDSGVRRLPVEMSDYRGAGGNAIAMTNRAVLERQARAWGPSALLGYYCLVTTARPRARGLVFISRSPIAAQSAQVGIAEC